MRETAGAREGGAKRLAVATPVYEFIAQRYFPDAAISIPDPRRASARSAADAVCSGSADAALMSHADLHEFLLDRSPLCAGTKLETVDTQAVMSLAVVARKEAREPADRLRRQIREMSEDGALLALAAQHPVPPLGAVRLADNFRASYRLRNAAVVAVASLALLSMSLIFLWRQSRTQKALRRSEERYRSFFEQAAVGMAEVEPQGLRFLSVNRALCNLLGYTREELCRRSFPEITHPEDAEQNVELYGRFIRGEAPVYSIEKRYLHKDGQPVWVRVEAAAVREPKTGAVLYTIGVIHDISGRKQMEQQLRESERRFRSALANAPFPAILHAEDGEILQTSRAWSEITGYSDRDVRTVAEWTRRAYGERSAAVAAYIETLYTRKWDERLDEGEYMVRTASGENRNWYFGSAPVGRDDRGRQLVLTMAADITELKRAQQQIRVLEGLLPICAGCKQIRDEAGDWQQLESYITARSHATFSHGLCPSCAQKYFSSTGAA
jgi:PAS domain S-box-containing protein